MFKRIIKIILILLAVFLLILGIIWLIGRHKAKENGTTPLSFKQFIGLSSPQSTTGPSTGSLSSNFTGNGSSTNGSGTGNGAGGNGSGTGTGISDVTNISNFTNTGFSPIGTSSGTGSSNTNNGAGGNGNGTTNGQGSSTTNNNGAGSSNGSGSSTGGTTAAPVCGTADTTITFTADQLTQLNALQNRFYSLAQTLHTDADVATELANHDAFALKAEQVTELYNYCESKLPLITDPQLQQHVATPFWDQWNANDNPGNQFWDVNGTPQGSGPAETDSLSFLYFGNDQASLNYLTQIHDHNTDVQDTSGISGPYGEYNFSNPADVIVDGSILNPPAVLLMPVVEHILRVNLW